VGKGKHAHCCGNLRGRGAESTPFAHNASETMRRRDVITLVGGGLAWPLDALVQGSAIPLIGFLNSESPKPFAQLVAAFRQGLNEQGYVEGRKGLIVVIV
jgi:hypothetical protein